MGQKQTGRYCKHCEKKVLAIGSTPSHLLHFSLSVFSLGLWIPFWILITLGKIGGYRCTQCGNKV